MPGTTNTSTASPPSVLMLAYNFPPVTSVGCNRTIRFSSELAKFGMEPIVHTVRNPDRKLVPVDQDKYEDGVERSFSINVGRVLDFANRAFSGVCKLVGINVKRNPIKRLLVPDAYAGWMPGCLWHSIRIVRRKKPSVIYASCSPFSTAVTGAILKQLTGLPLVLDFRDPWSFNDHNIQLWPHKKLISWIERWCVARADTFIANTATAAEKYRELYPKHAQKITHLYNGVVTPSVTSGVHTECFRLVYSGAVYDTEYLELLLGTLASDFQHDFEIIFTGRIDSRVSRIAERLKITSRVTQTGFLPIQKVSEIIFSASVLLFHNGFDRNGDPNIHVIKSKLYDYLASGRPILAIGPDGEVRSLIETYSPNSKVIASDFRENMKNGLESMFQQWNTSKLEPEISPHTRSFLEEFSPENLTRKLSVILKGHIKDDARIDHKRSLEDSHMGAK